MAEVALTINGHLHTLTCDDGQEARLRRLAEFVDARVARFVGSFGQVGEARLLLLAALVIADELSDANEALREERGRGDTAANLVAGSIDGLSARIEAIAARLETA